MIVSRATTVLLAAHALLKIPIKLCIIWHNGPTCSEHPNLGPSDTSGIRLGNFTNSHHRDLHCTFTSTPLNTFGILRDGLIVLPKAWIRLGRICVYATRSCTEISISRKLSRHPYKLKELSKSGSILEDPGYLAGMLQP